jgi:hypothetical protein
MKKRTYTVVLIIAALLFSLFSIRSTRQENAAEKCVFLPFSQAQDVANMQSSPDALLSFLGDSELGYIDITANRLYTQTYQGKAAIDNQGWIIYDRLATNLQLYGRDGQSRVPAYAYPWFKASWRILVRADQMGIARINGQGAILWEKEFSMPVTALDASSQVIAVGLLDGSLRVFDVHGAPVFSVGAGFQNIRAIYGVAVSGDSKYVVVLKGLSPQKIETYRHSESSYIKISESTLKQQFALQATTAFAEDDSHVIIACGTQLIYYNIKGNYIKKIELNRGEGGSADWDEDVQFFALRPTGGATVAVLQIEGASESLDSEVLILKHGLVERVAPDAISVSVKQGTLAMIYKDGIELLKGWRP